MTDKSFIETNGIRLATRIEGDGPLVILVHGFPETAYSWRKQVSPLVEAGYRVCVPDVRGYGNSGRAGGRFGLCDGGHAARLSGSRAGVVG